MAVAQPDYLADPPGPEAEPDPEHRIVVHSVTWGQYDALCKVFDEHVGLRMTYCEGVLELMTTSRRHEGIKRTIGRLLEAWADVHGVDLWGFGQMAMRKRAKERGLAPDECYMLSPQREWPDLAIEVALSRWLVDKLDVYAGLGIGEVWVWRRGRIHVHLLEGEAYVEAERSRLFPALDLAQLSTFVQPDRQPQALREYRAALRR